MFREARRTIGQVPEPFLITARRPQLLFATVVYEWAILKTPRVPTRLKMLAALRASSLVGCPF